MKHLRIDQLMDTKAIADRYGVKPETVRKWKQRTYRDTFPEPVLPRLWLAGDIDQWWAERQEEGKHKRGRKIGG